MSENHDSVKSSVTMQLVGLGGAGSNAIAHLHSCGALSSVSKIALDTDKKALDALDVPTKHCMGASLLRGLSSGGAVELGQKALEADDDAVRALLGSSDFTCLLVGLGGGTGGGAGPAVAKMLAENGSLLIAFAILPFSFEGAKRQKEAQESLALLEHHCDAVISLPNSILLQQMEESVSATEAFAAANLWFERAIISLHTLLYFPGLVNADFSHLQALFSASSGKTLFALGRGAGDHCLEQALQDLMLCPLRHIPDALERAGSLLVSVVASPDLDMNAINELIASVANTFSSKDQTVVNLYLDDSLSSSIDVCVIGVTSPVKTSGAPRMTSSVSSAINRAEPPSEEEDFSQKKKKRKGLLSSIARSQEEFDFVEESLDARGYFEKTDKNLFEGEDLDVPTYLRKGIKVNLR